MAQQFGNLDDFATSILFRLSKMPKAEREEYAALLFADPTGEVKASNAINGGQSGVKGKIKYSGEPLATAHNHPDLRHGKGDRYAGIFSEDDVTTARRLNLPSYILDQTGPGFGTVRRWAPGEPTKSMQAGEQALGTEVLAQFPIDEFRAYVMRELLNRAPDDARGMFR